MKRLTNPPILIAIFAAVAAIALSVGVAWYQVNSGKQSAGLDSTIVAPKVHIGGPFELVDHTGKAVSEKDFSGQFMLAYFGYSFCPDVCPTDLQVIGAAMLDLEERNPDAAKRITPVFFTVDPARDTADVMGEYVANFHNRMVGLTGEQDQVKKVAKAYRVYYKLNAPDEDGDYLVDHSAFVYFMGPDGAYRNMFKHNSDPLEMSRVLEQFVENEG